MARGLPEALGSPLPTPRRPARDAEGPGRRRREGQGQETPAKEEVKEIPMTKTGTLTVSSVGEREIRMVREFDASKKLVFEALTKPELVRQWLLGPDGWTMPVCEIDFRVGGGFLYVWRKEKTGAEMGMRGS